MTRCSRCGSTCHDANASPMECIALLLQQRNAALRSELRLCEMMEDLRETVVPTISWQGWADEIADDR